jgi:hypothetical protein
VIHLIRIHNTAHRQRNATRTYSYWYRYTVRYLLGIALVLCVVGLRPELQEGLQQQSAVVHLLLQALVGRQASLPAGRFKPFDD